MDGQNFNLRTSKFENEMYFNKWLSSLCSKRPWLRQLCTLNLHYFYLIILDWIDVNMQLDLNRPSHQYLFIVSNIISFSNDLKSAMNWIVTIQGRVFVFWTMSAKQCKFLVPFSRHINTWVLHDTGSCQMIWQILYTGKSKKMSWKIAPSYDWTHNLQIITLMLSLPTDLDRNLLGIRFLKWYLFVSCTTSHVVLCSFLESIEHDFIKVWMIHTDNQIVT